MLKLRMFAEKAIQLDKTLLDPHLVLGQVALLYNWDWDKVKGNWWKETPSSRNQSNLLVVRRTSCNQPDKLWNRMKV